MKSFQSLLQTLSLTLLVYLCVSLSKLLRLSSSEAVTPPEQDIQYKSHHLEQSVIHTLLIPAGSKFSVRSAISSELTTLANFAQQHQAIAVINGGFFDPKNQKTTSYIFRQGQLVADPRLNERLINNPNNTPYLNKILDRTEWRRYHCGQNLRYDIALRSEPIPTGCSLVDVLGGGPRLLPEIGSLAEGFIDVSEGKVIRDALGSNQPNARSAVGITSEGNILLAMVAQKPEAPTTSGMSLAALAEFMSSQGVEEAMNLDGGSSSAVYYQGRTFYGKVDKQGNQIKRKVLSVLLVQETIEVF
ncbi:MAG: phosphodiester glycosidase family protein [Symploca sp. SIO2E9]|nr:phosphodiester glycosidase family protein [Symploca sp. SIO2E9]